jgi:hypothetical protein
MRKRFKLRESKVGNGVPLSGGIRIRTKGWVRFLVDGELLEGIHNSRTGRRPIKAGETFDSPGDSDDTPFWADFIPTWQAKKYYETAT